MRKIRVTVLMGGKSSEHAVSLMTGKEIVKNLDKKKYIVTPLVIGKDNNKISIDSKKTDIVFIALHGPFGEDGTIQGLLETLGIKYTGSGVLASALGMDKIFFRKIMQLENIPIPQYISFEKQDQIAKITKKLGDPPYFVKPHNQGSSVGSSIVKKSKDLKTALKKAFAFSDTILVDKYIKGLEVAVGVVGNNNPIALPVIEIHPKKADFFDYESKYTESGAEEIVPARISKSLTEKLQKMAIKVYEAIGCRGFGRVDFILEDKVKPIVLEINTIPGLTSLSLLPKEAKAKGISYPKLLERIINYAFEK